MAPDEFDLAIIGAGSGGLTAAGFAARLGARVALIERDRVGGDCTWTGCIPSKALIHCASVAHTARHAARFGVNTASTGVDMHRVRDYVREAISRVYRLEEPELLRGQGIEVFSGAARFVDNRSVSLQSTTVRAKKFLIATGARPRLPAIENLQRVPFLTYENIFENDHLPGSMIVVGGGPIGVEIAQSYSRLGAGVTLIADSILPRDESESRELIHQVLASEGVRFVPARAESVYASDNQITVRAGEHKISGDLLFLACGRTPNTAGLDLTKAGVDFTDSGIVVDKHLRTTAPNIYAAGDVIGGPQFTHLAGWQAFQAVRNALLPGNSPGMPPAVPWVTYTDPEIAHAGLTEDAARAQFGASIRVIRRELDAVDRAVCEGQVQGFIKLITKPGNALVGATIVSPRAGEMISELMPALNGKLDLAEIAAAIHPYPTFSTAIQQMAAELVVDAAVSGLRGKILRALL